MSIPAVPYPHYHSDRWNYSIHADDVHHNRLLHMHVPSTLLYTSSLPATHTLLSQLEPRILQSKCFNSKKLPFTKEVKKTETAHLFEHILLEYLCQEQVAAGKKCVKFSGWTSWNWKKDARGIFHITISGNKTNDDQFIHAISRSILLFETILASADVKKKDIINTKQIDLDYLFVKRMHE